MKNIVYRLLFITLLLLLYNVVNGYYIDGNDYDVISMYNNNNSSNRNIIPVTVSNVLTISITNTQDTIGNPTYCSSGNGNGNQCNIRSAFMYCNLYSNTITNTTCQIGIQMHHQYHQQ
jgi:hypothetical protein